LVSNQYSDSTDMAPGEDW